MARRLLAIAVASGRAGYVFLIGNTLAAWHISEQATKSAEHAADWVRHLIADFKPDVVVTEKTNAAKKKGDRTKELIDVMAAVAADAELLDVRVEREQVYDNKYKEAAAIADIFPDLLPWVPKRRRIFDNEPRNTILFEAMALALVILRGPSTSLAAAMG